MLRPNPIVTKNRGHDQSAKYRALSDSLEYRNSASITAQTTKKAGSPPTTNITIFPMIKLIDFRGFMENKT